MKSVCLKVVAGLMALAIWVGPTWAVQALDIYKASALVKNQSEAERNRAARETLGEIVVRISGQLDALNNPQVRVAINQAQNYLFGFSYNSSQEKLIEGDKEFPAMEVQLNYSPQAIDQLLRQAQLPLWPPQRPSVLVWPVVSDKTGMRLELSPEILEPLKQRARYRGVSLLFPKGDSKDYMALSASDLWMFRPEKIRMASLRYRADSLLIARFTPTAMGAIPSAVYDQTDEPINTAAIMPGMTQSLTDPAATEPLTVAELSPGPWQGDWQLVRGSVHQSYDSETPELAGLLMQIADDLADEFARQYAIIPNAQGAQNIYLHLGGIADFGAFKLSQSYLSGLAAVKKMEVVKVDASGLLVSLTTEGDIKLLVTTLALGKKLQPLDANALTQALNQQSVETSVVSEADEAALAAELDAEIADAMGEKSSVKPQPITLASRLGTSTNPLQYVWLP